MRMGVDFGRLAVGRPARVADAERAVQRVAASALSSCWMRPTFLTHFQALAVEHGDAAGVVAAILQPAQTLQQEGLGFLVPEIRDNATHKRTFCFHDWWQRQDWGNGRTIALKVRSWQAAFFA